MGGAIERVQLETPPWRATVNGVEYRFAVTHVDVDYPLDEYGEIHVRVLGLPIIDDRMRRDSA